VRKSVQQAVLLDFGSFVETALIEKGDTMPAG
jgi:hypothetical protein